MVELDERHYPHWFQTLEATGLAELSLYALPSGAAPASIGARVGDEPVTLERDEALGGVCVATLADPDALPPTAGVVAIELDDGALDDLWMVLTWKRG